VAQRIPLGPAWGLQDRPAARPDIKLQPTSYQITQNVLANGRRPYKSFWDSLKNELTHHQHYETRAHAKAAIQEYIEIFYNRQRRHSRLGYQSPAVFAKNLKYLRAT
jgi:transposase InsO family protein